MDIMKDVMELFGISLIRIPIPVKDWSIMDNGLRGQLYSDNPYQKMELFENQLQEHTLYEMIDQFQLTSLYYLESADILVQLGPYQLSDADFPPQDTKPVALGLEEPGTRLIRNYILDSKVAKRFDNHLGLVARILEEQQQHEIEIVHLVEPASDAELRIPEHYHGEENWLQAIDERYRKEEEFLQAISMGDYQKAIRFNFVSPQTNQRYVTSFRSGKNGMLSFNTLCRRAVQNAQVHPAHIDSISAAFAREIENCDSPMALQKLFEQMVRRYCLLVRNFSLRHYSKLIQDTINYIDFHLADPLSLSSAAAAVAANKNYLSTQFRKETGSTLTDYINEKRIHESLKDLAVTSIPIREIAGKVGINDINYYSRIFKKMVLVRK